MTICALVMAANWMMVYRNDGYSFLRFLAVLTLGSIGCDFHKALKIYVIIIGTTLLVTVFCVLGDTITNLIYTNQNRFRSFWGIVYPTDFASYMIFLLVSAWIAWKNLPDWFFLIPGAGAFIIAYLSQTAIPAAFVLRCFYCLFFYMFNLSGEYSGKSEKLLNMLPAWRFLYWE